MLSVKELEAYQEMGITPPTSDGHGTEDDIRKNLKQLNCSGWRMEGNRLIAKTEMGELSQTIPTDILLVGEKDGLPIFQKIVNT